MSRFLSLAAVADGSEPRWPVPVRKCQREGGRLLLCRLCGVLRRQLCLPDLLCRRVLRSKRLLLAEQVGREGQLLGGRPCCSAK